MGKSFIVFAFRLAVVAIVATSTLETSRAYASTDNPEFPEFHHYCKDYLIGWSDIETIDDERLQTLEAGIYAYLSVSSNLRFDKDLRNGLLRQVFASRSLDENLMKTLGIKALSNFDDAYVGLGVDNLAGQMKALGREKEADMVIGMFHSGQIDVSDWEEYSKMGVDILYQMGQSLKGATLPESDIKPMTLGAGYLAYTGQKYMDVLIECRARHDNN